MFKLQMSAESTAQLEWERREAERFYALTNQWLAVALLRLAREARKATTLKPDDVTYDASLVWGVIPELARRLGRVKLEVPEIDWAARESSDYELRCRIGSTLGNVSERSTPSWHFLTRTPANGNPVAIGIDRLRPGIVGDRDDVLTSRIAEVAACRKLPYDGVWTPDLLID